MSASLNFQVVQIRGITDQLDDRGFFEGANRIDEDGD